MPKSNLGFLLLTAGALTLAACEGTKQQLGLTRRAPDEFAVVKRAPLEMPPDFSLRPPQPGAPRPQEALSDSAAREAVFGGQSGASSAVPKGGEGALLQQAGAETALPDIRRKVDAETAALTPKEKPVAERLLGWTGGKKEEAPATVVDAPAEAERLKKNAEEGQPVTAGETPSKDE